MHSPTPNPMHYVLCIFMHKLPPPNMVPPLIQCIMRIMHYEAMHYEDDNCTYNVPTGEFIPRELIPMPSVRSRLIF